MSGLHKPNPAQWTATWAVKMALSCPLWTTHCVPQEKFPRKPYNKSFLDQAYFVKITGQLASFFFGDSVH